jgi:hypothetical protein
MPTIQDHVIGIAVGADVVAYDTPWWAFPSSREGRFHRAGEDTVQYLSLHPLGPAAEMLRVGVVKPGFGAQEAAGDRAAKTSVPQGESSGREYDY